MNPALKRMLPTVLDWAVRIAIAAIFVLAAVPKILDPAAFAKAITNYRVIFPVIGQDYVYPVAMLMPALELVAAVAILLPRWKRAGALLSGGLFLRFIVLIGQAVARGLNIDCGCFGTGAVGQALAQEVGLEKLLENAALLLGCVFVFIRSSSTPLGKRYALAERARAWK